MAADRARRAPLSRERILDAALALADESGLDALSMRSLGRRLGVEAMSLYHHVRGKQELVAGIADRVWAEVSLAAGVEPWRDAVRRTARSALVAMLGHPWLLSVRMSHGGPARLAYVDASLGHLRRAGFSPADVFHAHHVLEAYISGYALQALDVPGTDPETARARAEEALRSLDAAATPHLLEHVAEHGRGHGSGFDFGLELILDGLERLPREP